MKILTEEKVVKMDQKVEVIGTEGLDLLLGETITLFCINYIYAGKLVGVNASCVKLDNAHIVFETGDFSSPSFKDAQRLGDSFYIRTQAIESFGILKALK